MGLGPTNLIGLGEARELARSARRLLHEGADPARGGAQAERSRKKLEAGKSLTFDACVAQYIASHEIEWKNPKHRQQWENTLKSYASPVFGKLPVGSIDTPLVMKAVQPIWAMKNETAARLRGRIETVLDWGKVNGYRTGDNPARWQGHLDQLLPARSKVRKVKHHAALPYAELPTFMPKLRAQEGIAARALEFLILTATRTGDIIGGKRKDEFGRTISVGYMTWEHVDLDGRIWTIPRTKNGSEHKVPLSRAAVAVLEDIKALGLGGDIVFPSTDKPGEPLSDAGMSSVLDRMGAEFETFTPHGFRATFKTWACEQTNAQKEVVEAVLAHGVISDKLEAAYRRGDFFEKRKRLMSVWAEFATTLAPGDNVVSLRTNKRS